MPSPFPGMDPFLERPTFFPGLHDSFVAYLREHLQAVLPAPYYAEISDRLVVELNERRIEPDVNVLHRDDPTDPMIHGGLSHDEGDGGLAVATAPQVQPLVITVPHDEHREPFLEIFASDPNERLVTTIEVLSPSNKSPGEGGRELYLRKQREVLDSQTHLVEIDLLRGGRHTTAIPEYWIRKKAGRYDYHVCIRPWHLFEKFFVYTILLEERLPAIDIPLLPDDPPVKIDLQAVFDRCYDTGPYRRRVRYAELMVQPELPPAQAEWVKARLAAVGT